MKKCTICSTEKELVDFPYQSNICKKCKNKKRHQYALNKEYPVSVTEKCCSTCKIVKAVSEFNRNKRIHDGLTYHCKECNKPLAKANYERNKEKRKKTASDYYHNKSDKEKRNVKVRERQKQRLKEDPHYLLTRRLRNRLYYALKKTSWKKNTKFSEYIGCTLEELRSHIESQFIAGMSWDNQGDWHIDHIKPLSSATTEQELYFLCHYTNLQPMWALDNIRKGKS